MFFACLLTYEPLFDWYKANTFICCVCVSVYPLDFSSLLASGGSCHPRWPRRCWRPCTGCCSYDDLDDDSDYGWVSADAPLTHLDASPKQSCCIHVAHFVMLPLLINISSLCARSRQPLHVWLSWGETVCLWRGLWFLFTFFSLRLLWVWPWSNYKSKVGECCFRLWVHNVGFF